MRLVACARNGGLRCVWLAGIALLSLSCSLGRYYKGTPLRSDPALLVEGQSTKADVLHLFGPPDQIMHQTDGDAFVYTHEQQNYSSLRVQDPITCIDWFTYTRQLGNRDRLVVLFDFFGIVRAVAVDHHIQDMPVL